MSKKKAFNKEEMLRKQISTLENNIKEKDNTLKRLQTIRKHQSKGIEMVDIDTQTVCDVDCSFQSSSFKEEIDKYKKQISQSNHNWQVKLNKAIKEKEKEWQIKYQKKIEEFKTKDNEITKYENEIKRLNKFHEIRYKELSDNFRDRLASIDKEWTNKYSKKIQEKENISQIRIGKNNILIKKEIQQYMNHIKQLRTELNRSMIKGKEAWDKFRKYCPDEYYQHIQNTYNISQEYELFEQNSKSTYY